MKNFRLGIRAIHQKDIKTAIIEAKKNGFKILEIHMSAPQFQPQSYTTSQLNEIKNYAKKNEIIIQTHSEIGQSLIQIDKGIRGAEQQRIKQYIQFSRQLGARCLTLHVGKSLAYHAGTESFSHDKLFPKFYTSLFEDSIKHLISIAPKDLLICIENDNFTEGYRKVLGKYLKTGKIFLTWDIMKNFQYKPTKVLYPKLWQFMKKNINYIRNVHISGPNHAGIQGFEKDFTPLLKSVKNQDLPIVIEMLSIKEAVRAKKIIQGLL